MKPVPRPDYTALYFTYYSNFYGAIIDLWSPMAFTRFEVEF